VIRILAACSPGEVRVAVVAGDLLQDYAIWRPGRPDGVGDLYCARVLAHVPALAGAFMALPEADGFLPDSEGGAGVVEGAPLLVRVTRAAQGGKGPRLTARLTARLNGRMPQQPGTPGLLARGPGAVERLAAQYPEATVVADDPAVVAALRPRLGDRLSMGQARPHEALAEQIEALSRTEALLPGGARASFHPTPALVAIDVDAGATTADRRAKAAAQLHANLALVPELARQIRLRNLSGAIVVDLAGMSLRRRAAIGPAFAAALAGDPLKPRFLGFSALGLAEIMRPRVHPPLHEMLAGPHAAGLAALRQIMRESARAPHAAFTLRAAPDVALALEHDPIALPALAGRTGRPLIPVVDPALPSGAWHTERADRA